VLLPTVSYAKLSYTVCIECDFTNSWYLNGNVCQSPTASPQIPSGYGASTSSYLVVPCSDSHCLLCKSNYLICTGCDTANSWYLNGATCQSPTLTPQIPSGYGANTVTGAVVACQDTHCLLCKTDYTTCTGCDTANSWYLNGAVCQSPTLTPVIPNFFGANTATGSVVACSPAHCLACKPNYLTCTACDTGNLWYLNGNVCQNAASFPSGFGPNTATGLVAPCSDPLCNSCPLTISTCAGCPSSQGYYTNPNTSLCIHTSQMPSGFGPDLVSLIVVACSISSCTDCHLNSSECFACDTTAGLYLFQGTCISISALPAGYGLNTVTQTIETCSAGIGCLDCKFDYSICSQCDFNKSFYLNATLCITPSEFSFGYGVDNSTGSITSCKDPHCMNCSANYQICTECDQANGYVLVDGTCQRITIISTAIKPTKADVDLSWRESVPETNIPVTTSTVLTALEANKARFRLYLKEDDRTLGKDDFQLAVTKYADSGYIVLDFTLPQDLPKEQYTVTLLGFDFNVTGNAQDIVTAEVQPSTSDYAPAVQSQSLTEGATKFVSFGTTVASTDSATGLAVMGAVLAADPTGAFFRFTKILQIVNKLYFININYGKRLEAFLAMSASPQVDVNGDPKRPEIVYKARSTRGKLSKYKITLSGIALPLMMYKIIVYVLSWLVRGAKRLLLDNCLMGKVGIYSCYYANKVHLIIFNLVFIDFIWLAPRTLMHSRGLSWLKMNSTIFVMCLIAADLCLLLAHLLDDRIWRRALEHYTSLKEFCPAPELSSKEKRNDSSMNALKKPDQPSEQDGPNQPQTKQINYKRTYFEIDFNVHLMDMATNTLSLTKDVYDSMIVRLLVAQLWFRVPLMGLFIMTTQYANCFGITIMLSIELSKLFATIYAYLKYKYLKNIICLLMELSQATTFLAFCSCALLISPKRFDETISDIYQDAGIWIVIASCVAEYLLLLTYIGVAAYDFFKNRRMMKKMNVQRKQQSLIKYSEGSSSKPMQQAIQPSKKYVSPLARRAPGRRPLPKVLALQIR
jgi:hypothetical protein